MDFLKKHYEKVLLGVVLIGLAAAVGSLFFKIASEKQKLEELRTSLIHPRVKPLTNLDLSMPESSLKRMAMPALLDLSTTNKLFHPMPWQQTRDNRLIRSDKAGPTAATVTNISPLYLRLSLDAVTLAADGTPKYGIGVQKEAAAIATKRSKTQTYMKRGDKNDTFMLTEANGPPENPTNIVLELNESGEKVVISKEQPYKRVDGYTADVRYDPEKQNWPNSRVGRPLHFNNEDYKIVAIGQNEVVISAKSNDKKWTIKLNPSP